MELATNLIQEAIKMDDKCEFAYETLAKIELKMGYLNRAVELFDKAIPLSKDEVKVAHLFNLKVTALSQLKMSLKLGVTLPSRKRTRIYKIRLFTCNF